jgi:hypothetical protein
MLSPMKQKKIEAREILRKRTTQKPKKQMIVLAYSVVVAEKEVWLPHAPAQHLQK